jgi:predicted transcriptional regulator
MITITVQLEPQLVKRLRAEAAARDISMERLVGYWLEERLEIADTYETIPLSPEEIDGIQRGLADIEAGRVYSHEDVLADLAKWRVE